MKKIILYASAIMITACSANLAQYTNTQSNASYKTKMKACLLNEANSKLQAGTLFNSSITSTAKELVNICIKNLALQSFGLEQESQSTAENIIQNLKNLATK